jgi:hypothetical protein
MPLKMKNFNHPPTPKQKKYFYSLTGIADPTDITCEGGMSVAINTIVEAKLNGRANLNVLRVMLPCECFCKKFTAGGLAKLEDIADQKYIKGMAVGQLGKAINRFNRAMRVEQKRAKPIDTSEFRRQIPNFERTKLEDMPVIKRR